MNGKSVEAMTADELRAENARLERELHTALEQNDRLRRRAEKAESNYASAQEYADQLKAGSYDEEAVKVPRFEFELPGVIKISLVGADAIRAFHMDLPASLQTEIGTG